MAEHDDSDTGVAWTTPPDPHLVSRAPRNTDRLALRALQFGALAVVIAAATWKQFELDRFFVPKELILHASAFTGGLLALRVIVRMRFSRVDLLLAGYMLLSVMSALLATNGWMAVRAVTLSASGIVVFWTARALRTAGLERPLLGAIAGAVVIAVATALLQTYGIRTDFFSLNRAPGGTLGNRNFIAHMAAFGLPVVLYVALRTSRWTRYLAAGAGATLLAATLVITRSRAGFLAFAAVLLVMLATLLLSPVLRRHVRTWGRLAGIALLAGAGIAAAVFVPNSLNWRSDNPYVESITGVANYQEGSGRGRLVQYRRSLLMAVRNPLLGVGPGNWGVEYPDYAAARDPSLDNSEPGTTSNPWPSSDWIAIVAERGFAAALLLALALLGIALGAVRQTFRADRAEDALAGAALLALLLAATVAGMFDAVLLLAPPTLLLWAAAGALWQPSDARGAGPGEAARIAVAAGVVFIAGIGAVRTTAQLAGMGLYSNAESTRWLARAAYIDPGNYRLRVRLARAGSGLGREARCEHAMAANRLLPNAREPRELKRGC